MKTIVKGLGIAIFATMLVFILISCKEPDSPDRVINIAAISGITAPAVGGTPVTVITEIKQYTGTVVWSPLHETFQNSTVYFATITLTPKKGYILEGVAADFFTVTGANTVSNDANSGVITAVFPITAGTIANPSPIDIPIEDITPITGRIPKTTINPTAQYTGTITWSPNDNPFMAKQYTATITLTPRAGFTLNGVDANSFKVIGATTVSIDANSNTITTVYTAIIFIDDLEFYLSAQPNNTATTAYYIWLSIGTNDFMKLSTIIGNMPNKYVYLDLSGSTITSIPTQAYLGFPNLTGITIPDSVTSIGEFAFSDCTSLTSINIPDSVTIIGEGAFSYCTSLASVTISNSVTSIGEEAFSGCTSLTAINVDAANTVYSSQDGILYNKAKTNILIVPLKIIGAITIPDSVTSIGDWAFVGCTSLTNVTIGNSVTSIGEYAFYECTSLSSVIIGNSVTSIGVSAFYKCTSLSSVTIGNSVTSIGDWAFVGCASLSSVNIPDSVTSIGELAFEGCTSLSSVNIPDSVTSIGSRAFSVCTGLTSVTFQGTITADNFDSEAFGRLYSNDFYIGDLREKYLAGGKGTYTRASSSWTWNKIN